MLNNLDCQTVKYIDTYGLFGLLKVRKAKREGWTHLGALRTGFIRKTHILTRFTGFLCEGVTIVRASQSTGIRRVDNGLCYH